MKKLYIVYVHITPDGMHYYGVTNNPKNRWKGNGCLYKTTALQPNADNLQLNELETFKKTSYSRRQREGHIKR